MSILSAVMPAWARWLIIGLLVAVVFMSGQMRGERIAGERHIKYVTAQSLQTTKITQAQAKVVIQTEIKYRDRIQKIYVQGAEIEKQVPVYVTQVDNDRCSINAGFVRVYNATWAGDAAGAAAESDRESSGISVVEVAETNASNATACRAWREQALGWREFYQNLKSATNQ